MFLFKKSVASICNSFLTDIEKVKQQNATVMNVAVTKANQISETSTKKIDSLKDKISQEKDLADELLDIQNNIKSDASFEVESADIAIANIKTLFGQD